MRAWMLLVIVGCAHGNDMQPSASPEMARTAGGPAPSKPEPEPAPDKVAVAGGDPCEGGQIAQQSGGQGLSGVGEGGAGPRGNVGAGAGAIGGGGPPVDTGIGAGAPAHRPEAPARIAPGTVTVEGALDVSDVQPVLRRGIVQLRHCYEQGLKRDPSLAGTLVIHFVIGEDGHVTGSDVVRHVDKDVDACIAARIRRFEFPRPKQGTAHVQAPFNLSPG